MQPFTNLSCRTNHCEEGPQSAAPSTPSSSSSTYTASSIANTEEQRGQRSSEYTVETPLTGQRRVGSTRPVPRASLKASCASDPGTPTITRLLYNCLSWLTGERMPKIPLEKGYSQMDWLRLAQSKKDLNGLADGRLRDDITMEEVRLHKTKEDAWMVFNGMVYNITPYLRFHPGGSEILMRAAGKDGTSLFMKYHAWVNIGALMGKCLVGRLALSPIQAQAAAEIQQARLERQQQPSQQEAEVSHQAASPAPRIGAGEEAGRGGLPPAQAPQIGAGEEAQAGTPGAVDVSVASQDLPGATQVQGTEGAGGSILEVGPPSTEGHSQEPVQSMSQGAVSRPLPQHKGVAASLL